MLTQLNIINLQEQLFALNSIQLYKKMSQIEHKEKNQTVQHFQITNQKTNRNKSNMIIPVYLHVLSYNPQCTADIYSNQQYSPQKLQFLFIFTQKLIQNTTIYANILKFKFITNKLNLITMSRKQSHEQKSTYQQSQSNIKSPYIQLLESKKKVYGHRFDNNRHNRSYGGQIQSTTQPISTKNMRGSVGSSKNIYTSQINNTSKQFKSISSEKYGNNNNNTSNNNNNQKRHGHTNQKIKRVRTQNAESHYARPSSSNPYYHNSSNIKTHKKQSHSIKQKLHQSLNVHPNSSNQTYQQVQFDNSGEQHNNQQFNDNDNDNQNDNNNDNDEQQFQLSKSAQYKQYLQQLINGNRNFNEKGTPYVQKKVISNYMNTSANQKKQTNINKNKYDYLKDFQNDRYATKKHQFQNLSFDATSNQNKRKRHLSQNKQRYQQNQHVTAVDPYNIQMAINQIKQHKMGLQNLQINDIDGLIQLIDNCVQQANQYVNYLSQKLEEVKQELIIDRSTIVQYQQQIKNDRINLMSKNQYVQKLEKQLQYKDIEIQNINIKLKQRVKDYQQPNMQIRNLLQIIQKLNTQNQKLKAQLSHLSLQKQRESIEAKMNRKEPRVKQQIHGKIDILNISIENKRSIDSFDDDNYPRNKDGKQFRQLQKEDLKKLKFIKPKYK